MGTVRWLRREIITSICEYLEELEVAHEPVFAPRDVDLEKPEQHWEAGQDRHSAGSLFRRHIQLNACVSTPPSVFPFSNDLFLLFCSTASYCNSASSRYFRLPQTTIYLPGFIRISQGSTTQFHHDVLSRAISGPNAQFSARRDGTR